MKLIALPPPQPSLCPLVVVGRSRPQGCHARSTKRSNKPRAASRGPQDTKTERRRQPGDDADRSRGGLGDILGPIGLTIGGSNNQVCFQSGNAGLPLVAGLDTLMKCHWSLGCAHHVADVVTPSNRQVALCLVARDAKCLSRLYYIWGTVVPG